MGRKNQCGSKSQRGAEVASVLYTLVESRKLVGIEPKASLKAAAEALIQGAASYPLPHELADGLAA